MLGSESPCIIIHNTYRRTHVFIIIIIIILTKNKNNNNGAQEIVGTDEDEVDPVKTRIKMCVCVNVYNTRATGFAFSEGGQTFYIIISHETSPAECWVVRARGFAVRSRRRKER